MGSGQNTSGSTQNTGEINSKSKLQIDISYQGEAPPREMPYRQYDDSARGAGSSAASTTSTSRPSSSYSKDPKSTTAKGKMPSPIDDSAFAHMSGGARKF